MSPSFRTCPWVVALALCLGERAEADFNLNVSVDGIQLGKHLLRPELKSEDLKNRVVLLEFWGVNCPPCLASMPKLAAWNFELQSLGLVVIGAHAQGGSAERVKATALSRGANFTIVDRAVVKDGADFRTIPHCMLFDHTGKCIYRGSPFEVEARLLRAVQQAPPVVLAGRKLTRLASLNTRLKREQSFGAVLKQVKASTTSKDGTTAEEAQYVVEKLTAYGQKLISDAKEKKEQEPLTTWMLARRVSTNFAGTDPGTEATTLLNDLKKDARFQADLKAWQTLQKVRNLQGQLRSPPGVTEATDPTFRRLNVRTLQQMTDLIKQMQKSAPESRATEAAQQIAEQLGLKLG